MERRSRSQTRRAGEGFVPGPQGASRGPGGRHASSGRLPETSHGQLSLPYSRPPEQARTLSPDRRDRYRASYREGGAQGNGAGPASMPGGQYPTSSSVPHSNSNSYNQYNQSYALNPRYVTGAEAAPPPRPLPPSSGPGYAAPGNTAPPRPDPPSSNPYNSTSPNVSPSKTSNLVPQDKAGSLSQTGQGPPHQVISRNLRCAKSIRPTVFSLNCQC